MEYILGLGLDCTLLDTPPTHTTPVWYSVEWNRTVKVVCCFVIPFGALESGDDDASFTASPEKVRLASQSAAALMSWWQVLRQWAFSASDDSVFYAFQREGAWGTIMTIFCVCLSVSYVHAVFPHPTHSCILFMFFQLKSSKARPERRGKMNTRRGGKEICVLDTNGGIVLVGRQTLEIQNHCQHT